METIEHAAIRKGGTTWLGHRHQSIRIDNGGITGKAGFLTSTGRFVDRFKACSIALAAGQITPEQAAGCKGRLSSDLIFP